MSSLYEVRNQFAMLVYTTTQWQQVQQQQQQMHTTEDADNRF